jgi:hypothetical protein
MVATVNSVVIAASAGLVLAALDGASLAVTLAAGTLVGAVALAAHRSHHRRGRDAYEPGTIDRFATLVSGTQTAEEAGSSGARTGRGGSDSSRDDRGASAADEP